MKHVNTMTYTLRKKIFSYKVEKMITTNRFVLFFQYNSITLKQWNILKNQILNKASQRIPDVNDSGIILNRNTNNEKTISMLFCKSKVLDEIHTPLFSNSHLYDTQEKYSSLSYTIYKDYSYNDKLIEKNSQINPKKLTSFFSQGPTVLISFNSIEIAKYIFDILENGINPQYLGVHKNPGFLFSESFVKTANCVSSQASSISHTTKAHSSCVVIDSLMHKIPSFTQTCNSIFKRKSEKLNPEKKSHLNQLFFIGAIAENQIIDHLDLKALIELNPFLYRDLIVKLYEPLMCNVIVLTSIKTIFVKTLNAHAINLINCLIFMKSLR